VVHPRREDAVARPGDEKKSPGGFETSAELRRTPAAEPSADAPAPAPSVEAREYERPSSRRRLVVTAVVGLALLAVAVALYLAV
jgi:hypothetical protein